MSTSFVGCYINDYTGTDQPHNLGYANDANRARATVYIDRSDYTSVGQGGLDLRYELVSTGYSTSNDCYAENFYIWDSYIGAASYALGGTSTLDSSHTNKSDIAYLTVPPSGR